MRILVLTSFSLLAACATVVRGTDQDVLISADPPDAVIELSTGVQCSSPCQSVAARDQTLVVSVSREGCIRRQITMFPSLAGKGQLLGTPIDYATGAVYDLNPNPLSVALYCPPASLEGTYTDVPIPEAGDQPAAAPRDWPAGMPVVRPAP